VRELPLQKRLHLYFLAATAKSETIVELKRMPRYRRFVEIVSYDLQRRLGKNECRVEVL
jgi:hypothetical protein